MKVEFFIPRKLSDSAISEMNRFLDISIIIKHGTQADFRDYLARKYLRFEYYVSIIRFGRRDLVDMVAPKLLFWLPEKVNFNDKFECEAVHLLLLQSNYSLKLYVKLQANLNRQILVISNYIAIRGVLNIIREYLIMSPKKSG